jgi:hypothetical protein
MQSVGGPVSIVATIITLVLVPVFKDGKVHFRTQKVTVAQITCERGLRIPPSDEARRLGVVGKICRPVIPNVRVVERHNLMRLKAKKAKKAKKASVKRARIARP